MERHIEVVRNTIRHLRVLNVQVLRSSKNHTSTKTTLRITHSFMPARFGRTSGTANASTSFLERYHAAARTTHCRQTQLCSLGDLGEQAYCGFCVVRPLSTAPIGRTVLQARVASGFDMEATVTCRADFDAHLLGDQSAGHGYCLPSARHPRRCLRSGCHLDGHAPHARKIWQSQLGIRRRHYEIRTAPHRRIEAVSIPNASDRLSTDAMVRAIAEAGYQPL